MTTDPSAGNPIKAQLYWQLVYHHCMRGAVGLVLDMFQEIEDLDAARQLPDSVDEVKAKYASAVENVMQVLQDRDGREFARWRGAWRNDRDQFIRYADDWANAQYESRPTEKRE